jgi:hypothetical protein
VKGLIVSKGKIAILAVLTGIAVTAGLLVVLRNARRDDVGSTGAARIAAKADVLPNVDVPPDPSSPPGFSQASEAADEAIPAPESSPVLPIVRVHVVDAKGSPLAGTRLELGYSGGAVLAVRQADDAGAATFHALPIGSFEVRVDRPGWHADPAEVEIATPLDEVEAEIRAWRTARAIGRVEGPDGTGLPEARVQIETEFWRGPMHHSNRGWNERTDEEGLFRIEAIPYRQRAEYRVHARHADYLDPASADLEIRPGETADAGILVLRRRAGSARGRIVEPDGTPVPRLALRIERVDVEPPEEFGRASGRWTRDDGTFRVSSLPAGAYALAPEGRALRRPALFEIPDPPAAVDLGDRIVETAIESVVRGRVVDSGYEPIEGAEVRIGHQLARTDAEGRFEIRTSDPGPVEATVRREDPLEPENALFRTLEGVPLDGRDLEIRLVPTGVLFTFEDADTGEPIRWRHLSISDAVSQISWSGPGTVVRLHNQSPGRVEFSIRMRGYEPVRLSEVLPPDLDDREHVVPVRLRRAPWSDPDR